MAVETGDTADDLPERLAQLATDVADSSRSPELLLTDAVHCVRLALDGRADQADAPWSVSLLRGATRSRRAATLAATDDAARAADAGQLRRGTGPSLSALESGAAQEAVPEDGAVLAHPLASLGHPSIVLTAYGGAGLVADDVRLAAQTLGFGAVGVALVLSALAHRSRAENLDVALQSSRRIGAAIGVLMCVRRCTYDQAFEALRGVSQRDQRKLREVADEVVLTGTLSD